MEYLFSNFYFLVPNLSLDPLEQSLLGANLPSFLSLPADAALAHRTVVISAEITNITQ